MISNSSERIEGQQLVDRNIVVGDVGAMSVVQCELTNCHVVIDTKESTGCIYDSILRNCTIEFKQKLKHARIFSNDFHGCTFVGKFQGVDFGRSPKPDPLTHNFDEKGILSECDFTHAVLDLCRLYSVDIKRQKFARLPQFVIPYEKVRFQSLATQVWPGKFGIFLMVLKDESPALSACTGTVSDFRKKYQLTDGELLQSLDAIGAVFTK